MRKRGTLFVWLFDICELQFGIVREVCYRLVLVSDLVICSLLVHCNFWISFVALSLVCAQLVFGIWYSYLVFMNLWFFGSYLVLWFCICERELFGCIWDLGF